MTVVEETLRRLGGVGTTAQLLTVCTRAQLRSALRSHRVVRATRGVYVLADIERDRAAAARWQGTVSHLSAALHHGWAVKWPPERPWVTFPRGRRVRGEARVVLEVAYADLSPAEVAAGVTSPLRTVLDCARRLPFDEALAVADSALRSGMVEPTALAAAAAGCRGPGTPVVRRVATEASPLAANPFESVLRALSLEVPGIRLVPQVPVVTHKYTFHPDLVDTARRLAVEADSWRHHTERRDHARDCVRYNALVLAGWTVLRFTWEQVMHSPDHVRDVLRRAAHLKATGAATAGQAVPRCTQVCCA